MTVEIVVAIVGVIVGLVGGGFGWSQIKRHGREIERRKQAEEERDDAVQIANAALRPPLTPEQSAELLRRVSQYARARPD